MSGVSTSKVYSNRTSILLFNLLNISYILFPFIEVVEILFKSHQYTEEISNYKNKVQVLIETK